MTRTRASIAPRAVEMIAQSACLSGEPCYYLRCGDAARAAQAAAEMKAIFGDRYYLELQRNDEMIVAVERRVLD